ncbi:hypothetical protein N9395_09920 [Pseudomonadales bacterium]|nr:hypothetical protein [Pseudomonadales bacterium]
MVELVSVILLITIVVAFGRGRFIGSGDFDELIHRNTILSLSRATQQAALSRGSVTLEIEAIGSNLVLSSIVSGAVSTTRSFPTNEVAITAGSVGSGTTCGSISSTITLNFDSAGEIEAVDDDGFPICLNGESSLCISPAGFAHQGACR